MGCRGNELKKWRTRKRDETPNATEKEIPIDLQRKEDVEDGGKEGEIRWMEEFVLEKVFVHRKRKLLLCSGGIFSGSYTRFWSRFWPAIYFGFGKSDSGMGGTRRRLMFMKQKENGVWKEGWTEPLLSLSILFSFPALQTYIFLFFEGSRQRYLLRRFPKEYFREMIGVSDRSKMLAKDTILLIIFCFTRYGSSFNFSSLIKNSKLEEIFANIRYECYIYRFFTKNGILEITSDWC